VDIYDIYKLRHIAQSVDFDQYYRKPILPEQKVNDLKLVYIYAESLEKTYFDESIFPNLVNNLKNLKDQSIEFTDIHQVVGTGWTMAGIIASQCSVPLFASSGSNTMSGSDIFLSGAECLGNVLKKFDYHLVSMQGSSADFSGIKQFYTTHSFDEIYGREELENKLDDKKYMNNPNFLSGADNTLFHYNIFYRSRYQ